MKKLYSLIISLIVFCSCNGELFSDLQSDSSEICPIAGKTWQEQLDESIKTKTKSDKDIYLNGYTYKGKINSRKEISKILSDMFSESSAIVHYTDSSLLNYEIVSIGSLMQSSSMIKNNDVYGNLKSKLQTIVKEGMELVELEWVYKGEIYYSTAIASNEYGGIIYDNIGTYIIKEKDNNTMQISVQPLIKTRSESGNPSVKTFTLSYRAENYFGMFIYEYDITCKSYFNASGILTDRETHAYSNSALGWECEAEIKSISGEINVSNYHEFAWAYAYGLNCSITIGWNGSSYVINGGSHKAQGTEIHRP